MNEITTYVKNEMSWIHSRDRCEHMVKLATNLHASGILPEYVKSPQVAFALMVKAHALGLPEECAWDFLYLNPYNKKVELATTAKVALIAKAGGVIKTKEYTGEKVTIECYRPNWGAEEFTFTIADAQKAGLTTRNQNYAKYPAEMLWARAVSRASSRMFPDVILGIDSGDFEGHGVADPGAAVLTNCDATPIQIAEKLKQEVLNEAQHEEVKRQENIQAETIGQTVGEVLQSQSAQEVELKEKTESKAVPEAGPKASTAAGKTNRRRNSAQFDATGSSGTDLKSGISAADNSAANSESVNDNISSTVASGNDEPRPNKSDSTPGIRDGLQGSGSEGQVRQHEHPLPGDVSENTELRHIKSTIESRIPGARVTGRRLGSWDKGNPEHLSLLSEAAKQAQVTVEFRKTFGSKIVEMLDTRDVDATPAAVLSALQDIMIELVPF